MTVVAVTRALVQAPLPQIIEKLGVAVAQAQAALDRNSIETAKALAEAEVELGGETYNLLTLGFTPSFYTFTEATVEAKMVWKALMPLRWRLAATASSTPSTSPSGTV